MRFEKPYTKSENVILRKHALKARRTPVKQIAWNMLHEIWNICRTQQINIFQWNSAQGETRNICFLKYISWNLRSCHVLCRFKWKDYKELCEIYFLSVHWVANETCLCNMFHRRALHLKWFVQKISVFSFLKKYVETIAGNILM